MKLTTRKTLKLASVILELPLSIISRFSIALFFAAIFCSSVNAQTKPLPVYLNLSSVQYKKGELDRIVAIKTTRKVHTYIFHIPCKNCQPGSTIISFSGDDNPETGYSFNPITVLSEQEFKKVKFTSFTDLVAYLKKNDNVKKAKLYFIETENGQYTRYEVKMIGGFGTE